MYYTNGEFYDGQWLSGKKHGEGVYKTQKTSVKGEWMNGELINER